MSAPEASPVRQQLDQLTLLAAVVRAIIEDEDSRPFVVAFHEVRGTPRAVGEIIVPRLRAARDEIVERYRNPVGFFARLEESREGMPNAHLFIHPNAKTDVVRRAFEHTGLRTTVSGDPEVEDPWAMATYAFKVPLMAGAARDDDAAGWILDYDRQLHGGKHGFANPQFFDGRTGVTERVREYAADANEWMSSRESWLRRDKMPPTVTSILADMDVAQIMGGIEF